MKALWLKQPYATLMLHGKIETRTRNTNVRGDILLCSTKTPYSLSQQQEISGIHQSERIHSMLGLENLPNSVAIGIGTLVDSRKMQPEDADNCFVEYSDHRWCWVFENIHAVKPFFLKGKQGWKEMGEPDIEFTRSPQWREESSEILSTLNNYDIKTTAGQVFINCSYGSKGWEQNSKPVKIKPHHISKIRKTIHY